MLQNTCASREIACVGAATVTVMPGNQCPTGSSFSGFPGTALRHQQSLDRPPLVHRAIAFGDIRERERQIEHLARM